MGVLSRIADRIEASLGDDPAQTGLADPTPEEPTRG